MTGPRRTLAFTVVEILVALSISAVLLTAIAVAMHAALYSYEQNEESAAATHTARTILDRMSRDIRTAQAVDYSAGVITIIPPDDGSGISEVEYEQVGSELIYRVTKDGTQSSHELISSADEFSVGSFTISEQTGQDWQGYDCIKSLSLELEVDIGGKSFTFAATASPRRNRVF